VRPGDQRDRVRSPAWKRGHDRRDRQHLPRRRASEGSSAGSTTADVARQMRRGTTNQRGENAMEADIGSVGPPLEPPAIDTSLLRELVAYLRENRPELREAWVARIADAQLLRVMSSEEIFSEMSAVYDNYVDALETGSVEALRDHARALSERIIHR